MKIQPIYEHSLYQVSTTSWFDQTYFSVSSLYDNYIYEDRHDEYLYHRTEIKSVTAFFRFARKRQSWSIIGQIFVERYIHQTKQRLAFNVDLSRCSTYRSNISSPLQRLIAWTSIVHPSNVSRHVSSGQDLRFSLSINFACTFARLSRKLANIASVAIRFVADRSSFSRRNGVSLPSPPTRRRFRHVAQLRRMTEGKQKIFQIKHSGQIDTRGQDERNDLQRNDSRKTA